MCGHYTTPAESEAERYFLVHLLHWQFSARYNVAPSQPVPAVRLQHGAREGLLLRWGLVPFFAHGIPGGYATINGRIETLTSSPAYRGAWKRAQRCILPATGFYEWVRREVACVIVRRKIVRPDLPFHRQYPTRYGGVVTSCLKALGQCTRRLRADAGSARSGVSASIAADRG